MDKRLKFNEPWILQRADPYVYDKDGWFVAAPICHNGRNSLGKGVLDMTDEAENPVFCFSAAGDNEETLWGVQYIQKE